MKIKQLHDRDNNPFIPLTHIDAVLDNEGKCPFYKEKISNVTAWKHCSMDYNLNDYTASAVISTNILSLPFEAKIKAKVSNSDYQLLWYTSAKANIVDWFTPEREMKIPANVRFRLAIKKSNSESLAERDIDEIIEEAGFSLTYIESIFDAVEVLESENENKENNKKAFIDTDMGLPCDVPVVKVISSKLSASASNNSISPLNTTKNEVGANEDGKPDGSVKIEFSSNGINFTDDIIISYQGQTSLSDAKKNFSIDMSGKHKFGKWLEFDSFHLKGFYTDYFSAKDWVCNQIMEQIYQSRKIKKRPFQKFNDFANDYRSKMGGNAMCHVDGFPVELYFNDVYWGLYVWRTKKHRNNYLFDKKNTNHIFLDVSKWWEGFSWNGVEIRNPKSDSGNTTFEEEVEPADGEVKTAITQWKDFMWSITESTPRSEIEEHFDTEEFIDVYLLTLVLNVWDSWSRNTLYGSWDGKHFAPMVYDMNNAFYAASSQNDGTFGPYTKSTAWTFNQKAYKMTWFKSLETIYLNDIKNRYDELKNLGIFTEENIIGLFNKWLTWCGFDVFERTSKRWSTAPSYQGLNGWVMDSMENLTLWVRERLSFLNDKIPSL